MQQQVADGSAAEPRLEIRHRDIPDREKSKLRDQIAAPVRIKFDASNLPPRQPGRSPPPIALEAVCN